MSLSSPQRYSIEPLEPLEPRVLLSGRVIGYFPEYRYNSSFNNIDFDAVTHVNYFSVFANSNGSLNTGSPYANLGHLASLVSAAHSRGVTVSVVIDPGSAFVSMMGNATSRSAFIDNIVQFCSSHLLDGIDLDWEPSWGTLTHTDVTNYGNLIDGLRAAAPDLLLSAAVNPEMWIDIDPGPGVVQERVIPLSAANTLDWIGVMGYDLDYANHSIYQRSINDLNGWYNYVASAGVPRAKLVLGVPFYGRSGTSWSNTRAATYHSIVNAYITENGSPPSPDADSITANVDGAVRTWYFNGPTTIADKAQYVKSNEFGGIMIWELAQDHFSAQNQYTSLSLLPVIDSIITPAFATLSGGTLTVDFANAGGAVQVSQAGGSYTISAPAGSESFPADSVSSIVINGTSGNDALHIDTLLAAPAAFNGGAGADALHVHGGAFTFVADASVGTANLSVTVHSGASVVFDSTQHLAALTIDDGAVASLSAHGGRVLVTEVLTITGAGRLDLFNNHLILDYGGETPASQVRGLLISGRGGGSWNGSGIMTSSAAGAPGTGLGYADAAELFTTFPASFAGESIDDTSVIVSYTRDGDANLDRRVDVADLGILASHWQQSPRTFAQGDLDYNGVVDVNDLGILASHWQQQLAAPGVPFAPAARPAVRAPRLIDQLSA